MILHSLVGLAGRFVTTAYNPAPLVDLRKTDPFFPSLLLRRGDVEVHFGKPLRFEPGTPYEVATAEIEKAVRAL